MIEKVTLTSGSVLYWEDPIELGRLIVGRLMDEEGEYILSPKGNPVNNMLLERSNIASRRLMIFNLRKGRLVPALAIVK